MFKKPLIAACLIVVGALGSNSIPVAEAQGRPVVTPASSLEAVRAYVERSREVNQSEYSVKLKPTRNNFHVFLVTMSARAGWIVPAERVFEVYVDSEEGTVVGEGRAQ